MRGQIPLRALLVVSLLPVSEINQCFRSGCGRTGGGWQAAVSYVTVHGVEVSGACASQLEATPR